MVSESRLQDLKSLARVVLKIGPMFDRMPKIVCVTWPRPRPLSGKIICAPARHSWHHTKFEVSSSSSFRDIAL